MTVKEIRDSFKKLFRVERTPDCSHRLRWSSKDDPTLMFTNAGMNQFKAHYSGQPPGQIQKSLRYSQKCLRVSGKHNDLEEVGHPDTYHHTMFEMLGNWSFRRLLQERSYRLGMGISGKCTEDRSERSVCHRIRRKSRRRTERDNEAASYWEQFLPKDHILNGNKHDNFWEMGDTGPCCLCSEIHIDSRSEEEKLQIPGNQNW